jgi:hypothetical protein
MSALVSLLESLSNSRSIVLIRDSSYGMPAVQSVHLVGLTVLLAAIVILDLRLAGVGMNDWSLPSLERQLRPLTLGALTLVIASGILIFLGTPAKYLASTPFLFKMTMLASAILLQFGLLRRFFTSAPDLRHRSINVVVASLSMTLWFMVGWAGRAIAFV